MKHLEMVCIVCPVSCHLEVEMDDAKVVHSVTGNSCPRGDAYARKENTNPTRKVTSTVKIKSAIYDRCPVITSDDVPKDRVFDVMSEIEKVEITAPVTVNQILVPNILGLGVDIVASRSMEKI